MTAKKSKAPKGNPAFDVGAADAAYDNPIRCGVVGLGRIGWCHHSQIMMKHNGFELTAACDLEQERLDEAQAASGCATYKKLGNLLKNEDIELVVIATQSRDHQRMSIQASKAGKHVLSEKPAARSAAGIDRMIAAARDAGKILTMHHNYRLNPEFLYVREVIDSGVLGTVVRLKRRVQGFARRNDWQTLRKYGGGMVGNWGIHLVDQCLQLLDSPVRDVWGDVKHLFNPGDAEDDIKCIIRGESGMTCDIDMTSVCAAPEPSWVINGTCGTLWIKGKKAHLKTFDPAKLPHIEPNDLHYAIDRKYGVLPGPDNVPWEEREEETKPSGTYGSYYDNLYAAVREGAELVVPPESARMTYAVLDKVRRGSGF